MINNLIINRGLLSNIKNSNPFHTSVSLYVESDKGYNNDTLINSKDNIRLSDKEVLNMNKDLDEFKEVLNMNKDLDKFKDEITKIKEEEIFEEMDYVHDYMVNNNSSVDNTYSNYVRELGSKKEIVDDNVKEDSISVVLSELNKILQKCKEAGIEKNCLEKIQISGITEKVLNNNNTVIPHDIKSQVESLVIDQLNKIGNMRVYEVLEKVKTFQDKFDLDVNKLEIGLNLVSYGLLLRAFNKFVYNRPIPAGFSAQDIVVLRQVRSIGRVWFAGVVAPLMLFSFHSLIKRNNLLDVKIEINNKESSSMFIIFLIKNMGKKVKMFTIFILIVIFLYLYWNGEIYYKYLNYDLIYPYLKILLLISIILPIVINVVILLLFVLIERKGPIYRILLEKNILNKFIGNLIKICSNKELLSYYRSYYRSRNTAEIIFYALILLLALIIYN